MIPGILATFVVGFGIAQVAPVSAPPPRWIGDKGPTWHVVYVCDASETVRVQFDALQRELLKSIDALKPVQEFTVIFLADDQAVAMSDGTSPALVENKRKAVAFVNGFRPSGAANPVAGLRAAFATGPHFIYLVTNGDLAGGDQVVEALHTLNRDKRVNVNTIALRPSEETKVKLLARIAAENGGTFRTIGAENRQR